MANGIMIPINENLAINDSDIQIDFIRSSGPGGQNVNKVATAVQLRFRVVGNHTLPEEVQERLTRLAGKRMTGDGVLIILARRFRTQERNRQDALDRLVQLIQKATLVPRRRRVTRPSPAAKQRRLEQKRRRSEVKSRRQQNPLTD